MTLVIDAHAHVFDRADRDPRGVSELVPAERDATIERFSASLAGIGAHHAVLVPLDAADEYVAACLAAEPDRFRAVMIAGDDELGRTDRDPVEAIAERLERMPASAVRTMWLGDPARALLDSPAMPLLRELAERDLVLWSYLPPAQAPLLESVARELPSLRIVLNHYGFTPHDMRVDGHGRPWFAEGLTAEAEERVLRLADHDQVHLMCSGQYAISHADAPYHDLVPVTARLVDAFGAERTMWGSDFPWIERAPGYAATFDVVSDLIPGASQAEYADIVGGTAARLLGFASPTASTIDPQEQ